MKATTEEVAAMKRRLAEKQAQRRFDADADEAIRLVQHRMPLVVEERVTPMEKREYVAKVIPAARAFSLSAIAVILVRAVTDNALFLLVLGLAVFAGAAVA